VAYSPALPGPVFIIGAMGSGPTLLRLMLDSHEHIAIPHETGFMRSYRAMQFIPFKWTGRGWARRLGWTDEELDAELRVFYDKIFSRYATEHGAQRWGEKTPLHTWHVGAMARLFPDAVFIGMVRHPGASTASNMKRFHHRVNRMAIHYDRYTREVARQVIALPDRSVLVRYEDLVLRPEETMRELLDWLGEPWSDRVLEHHLVQGERSGRVEGQSRADEPIDPSRIGKWKTTMRADHQRWLAERAARRAEFFGYGMDEPLPVAPFASAGGFVVYGPEIAERMKAFEDLELHVQRDVPIYDAPFDPRTRIVLTREQFDYVTRPRGVRGAVASVVKRLPTRPRQWAVKAVRSTRAALGLRRRPRRAG